VINVSSALASTLPPPFLRRVLLTCIQQAVLNPHHALEYVLAFNNGKVYYSFHQDFQRDFERIARQWSEGKGVSFQGHFDPLEDRHYRNPRQDNVEPGATPESPTSTPQGQPPLNPVHSGIWNNGADEWEYNQEQRQAAGSPANQSAPPDFQGPLSPLPQAPGGLRSNSFDSPAQNPRHQQLLLRQERMQGQIEALQAQLAQNQQQQAASMAQAIAQFHQVQTLPQQQQQQQNHQLSVSGGDRDDLADRAREPEAGPQSQSYRNRPSRTARDPQNYKMRIEDRLPWLPSRKKK
jgi:hypothetical protein